MISGTIIKIVSNNFTVKYHNKIIECRARGKFRNDKIIPMVGDLVEVDAENRVITDINKRSNELVRPMVSNVEQALVVMSVVEPKFDTYLLDKLLLTIESKKIEPAICLTKIDLASPKEIIMINQYIEYYQSLGYKVVLNNNINGLLKIINNKITVMAGQSGAGKSSLLNKIDNSLNIKTNEISKALGRGKHTTRHTELIPINDGFVVDTPGFSSLNLDGLIKEDIALYMREFNANKNKCKFSNCSHIKEEKCYIKEMLSKGLILESRYNNYKRFVEEAKKW